MCLINAMQLFFQFNPEHFRIDYNHCNDFMGLGWGNIGECTKKFVQKAQSGTTLATCLKQRICVCGGVGHMN